MKFSIVRALPGSKAIVRRGDFCHLGTNMFLILSDDKLMSVDFCDRSIYFSNHRFSQYKIYEIPKYNFIRKAMG